MSSPEPTGAKTHSKKQEIASLPLILLAMKTVNVVGLNTPNYIFREEFFPLSFLSVQTDWNTRVNIVLVTD